MVIAIPRVSPDGSHYKGEEPGGILGLENDSFVRPGGPIRYELFAHLVSERLVVKGRLETTVNVLCGRCAGFFSTTLGVSSFLRAYDVSGGLETVDLTQDIREDILVSLPSFPKCSWEGEDGVCPSSGVDLGDLKRAGKPAGDARWDILNGLDT